MTDFAQGQVIQSGLRIADGERYTDRRVHFGALVQDI